MKGKARISLGVGGQERGNWRIKAKSPQQEAAPSI